MTERETLEADVLIVGAGPAGLATALHLGKLYTEAQCRKSMPAFVQARDCRPTTFIY